MNQLEQAAAMAQQYQQQANANPQSTTSENKDDNVVDADFTEKK